MYVLNVGLCVLLILVIFMQSHAEEYLKMVNKQVLTLPIIERGVKKTVKIAKWYNRQTYLNIIADISVISQF